ncbi:MAG: hypothetical protein IKF14_05630 [Atopobiaceae bacterium]|nr:hypothetical protein [Atopobiaceae bacterium]
MKTKMNDSDLNYVNGGTVYLSRDYMKIGFSTLNQTFSLKNCDFYEALNYVDFLYNENTDLSDEDFDKLVRQSFRNRGWL